MTLRIRHCADSALCIELGEAMDRALSRRVIALARALADADHPGITETVPGYASLTVHYDPLLTTAAELAALLERVQAGAEAAPEAARHWRIPVCYEGEHAPDLAAVAAAAGMTTTAVIDAHCAPRYHCYLLGFVPGFAYLGDLDPALVLPRRDVPRTRVPAGSVAIADRMTAIYPLQSPGGWHLLGSTPVRLFDAGAAEPALLRAGDTVRFEPVDATAIADIARRVAAGEYRLPMEASG